MPSPVAGGGVVLACAPKGSPVYAFKSGAKGTLDDSGLAWKSPAQQEEATHNQCKSASHSIPAFDAASRSMCFSAAAAALLTVVLDVFVSSSRCGKAALVSGKGFPKAQAAEY